MAGAGPVRPGRRRGGGVVSGLSVRSFAPGSIILASRHAGGSTVRSGPPVPVRDPALAGRSRFRGPGDHHLLPALASVRARRQHDLAAGAAALHRTRSYQGPGGVGRYAHAHRLDDGERDNPLSRLSVSVLRSQPRRIASLIGRLARRVSGADGQFRITPAVDTPRLTLWEGTIASLPRPAESGTGRGRRQPAGSSSDQSDRCQGVAAAV